MLKRILSRIIYIILPLIVVGALLVSCVVLIWQGVNYWIDVSGTAYDKSIDFTLQPYGKGTVIYPEFIRPNATQKIEIELTPSKVAAASTMVSVIVRKSDSFLTITPTVITTTMTSVSVPVPLKFDITARNPKVPPKRVDIDIEVYDTVGQRLGYVPISLPINAWTGKITSAAAILGGLIGVLATTASLAVTIRRLTQ